MIGKFEANKDLIQELTSSGARHVGNIAGIITGTVAEVTREIGEWITDAIEMSEAAAAARRDAEADRDLTDAELIDDEPADDEFDVPLDREGNPVTAQPYLDAEVVRPEPGDR